MKTMKRSMLLAIGLFVCATVLQAATPEVRDRAGLFSSSATRQANQTLQNIRKEFGKELLVETFGSVPEDRKAEYERGRESFFNNFARERARSEQLNGIYAMVMKEPPPRNLHIQVVVGQNTSQKAFVPADRDQLIRIFQTNFKEKDFDKGLRDAVAFVERTMRSHLAGNRTAAVAQSPNYVTHRSTSFSPLMWILFIVGGIFLVSFLMRMLGGRSGPVGSGYGSGGFGGGGGGFFSGLLGGIGGALAGSWLYDRFFSHNAHADDQWTSSGGGYSGSSDSDVGGDYSTSGGDVDPGSGSDFGGGDFGGGDFGGGGGDA